MTSAELDKCAIISVLEFDYFDIFKGEYQFRVVPEDISPVIHLERVAITVSERLYNAANEGDEVALNTLATVIAHFNDHYRLKPRLH